MADKEPPTIEECLQLLRDTDPERLRWRAQYGMRLARAVMLAPTIEICEALLLNEAVPIDRLDPVWVERYRLREDDVA